MNYLLVREIVERALREDVGRGDISTEAVISPAARATGAIQCRSEAVVAGLAVARDVFSVLDSELAFTPEVADGSLVSGATEIARLKGSTSAILTGERTALNFLQRMSGIASQTREIVEAVAPSGVRVVDTRKTAPGLRLLDKYAVRLGGGANHRFGLDDAVLLKDNHLRAAGGVAAAVARVREQLGHMVVVEVEVTSLQETRTAVEAGVDVIMLDNMDPATMREAVGIVNGAATVEASGGITVETAQQVAETGVDVISVGSLTHSVQAPDISLNLVRDG